MQVISGQSRILHHPIYTMYISRDFESRDIFCDRFVTLSCSLLPHSLLIGLDHS
jgi:hypothetical protein